MNRYIYKFIHSSLSLGFSFVALNRPVNESAHWFKGRSKSIKKTGDYEIGMTNNCIVCSLMVDIRVAVLIHKPSTTIILNHSRQRALINISHISMQPKNPLIIWILAQYEKAFVNNSNGKKDQLRQSMKFLSN